jgi:hypothetical protein
MLSLTDWPALARARGLKIPEAELERVIEPLIALERRFRPLVDGMASDLAPAIVFRADQEQGE